MRKHFRLGLVHIFVLSTVLHSHLPYCCARTVDFTSSALISENVIDDQQQMMQRHPVQALSKEHIRYGIQRRQLNSKQLQPGNGAQLVPIIRRKRDTSSGFQSPSESSNKLKPTGLQIKKSQKDQEDETANNLTKSSASSRSSRLLDKLNNNSPDSHMDQVGGLSEDGTRNINLCMARSTPLLNFRAEESKDRSEENQSFVNAMSSKSDDVATKQTTFAKRNSKNVRAKETRKKRSIMPKEGEAAFEKRSDSSSTQDQKCFVQNDKRFDLRNEESKIQREENPEESLYAALAPRAELEESVAYDEEAEDETEGRGFRSEVRYRRNNERGSSATAENLEKSDADRARLEDELESKSIVKRDAEKEDEYEDDEEQDDRASLIDVASLERGELEEREEAAAAAAMEDKGRGKMDTRVKRDENDKVTGTREVVEREDEANNAANGETGKEEEIETLKRNVDSVAEAKIDDSKYGMSSAKRRENEKAERKEENEELKQNAKVNVELKIGREGRGDSKRDAIGGIDKEREGGENLKSETKANVERDNSKRTLNVDSKARPGKIEEGDAARSEVEAGVDEKLVMEEDDNSKANQKSAAGSEVEDKFDESSKQQQGLDTEAKEGESDADYERRVEQQIQRKIDSIKEEIKREVEQKQKIQEIEDNNAKYDELQSREDEDEEGQSLEVPSENQSVSKRSIQREALPKIAPKRGRRQTPKRAKRSGLDVDLHRSSDESEENDKLDPDVYEKSHLLRDDTLKRSVPFLGDVDKVIEAPAKSTMKKRSLPRKVSLTDDARKKNTKKRRVTNSILIPEQAHAKVEDELPADLTLDPSLRLGSPANEKIRIKRNSARYERRRRANAVVPEGRMSFLGYRPQDDDENDEGNEFDDDGFEDRTSNLRGKFYVDPSQVRYQEGDEVEEENPGSFLFLNRDSTVRRKRANLEAASTRRQGLKAKRSQLNRMTPLNLETDRYKRSVEPIEGTKLGSMASLIGSSQELSPQLATEYKEAFGGLQGDAGGALARFKRVKRALRSS